MTNRILSISLKFLAGLLLCTLLRLIPWRPPNVEPLTAALLPFGRTFGPLAGLLFGTLNIVLFDAFTSGIGTWTAVTALTFGIIGMAAAALGRMQTMKGAHYLAFAIIATLFYDGVTGVLMGDLLYDVPLRTAFSGQIPFTVNHLLGNIVLCVLLSPLIERWITANPRLNIIFQRTKA